MESNQKLLTRATLAVFSLLFVSGCFGSIKPAVRPVLPEMPASVAAKCYEPGVATDALVALTDARLALADCRRKQAGSVAFYQDVKGRMQ